MAKRTHIPPSDLRKITEKPVFMIYSEKDTVFANFQRTLVNGYFIDHKKRIFTCVGVWIKDCPELRKRVETKRKQQFKTRKAYQKAKNITPTEEELAEEEDTSYLYADFWEMIYCPPLQNRLSYLTREAYGLLKIRVPVCDNKDIFCKEKEEGKSDAEEEEKEQDEEEKKEEEESEENAEEKENEEGKEEEEEKEQEEI
jgi:hypothetical protein